jgi:hypothetical protein
MWSRDNIAEILVECLNNSTGLYFYGDFYGGRGEERNVVFMI